MKKKEKHFSEGPAEEPGVSVETPTAESVSPAEPVGDPVVPATPAPAAQLATDELAGLEEHFSRGSWGGMEQLRCRHCAWDTLNGPAAMLDHLHGNHVAAPGVGSVLLADRSGKEVS